MDVNFLPYKKDFHNFLGESEPITTWKEYRTKVLELTTNIFNELITLKDSQAKKKYKHPKKIVFNKPLQREL